MALTNKQESMVRYIRGTRATAPAEIADANPQFYNPWESGEPVQTGDRRRDNSNGLVYEVYAPAGDNLYPPHQVLNIWRRVWEEEWPDWVQPAGAHDAYGTGAKVTHSGKRWTSNIDGNTTEPGLDERWWTEYIEEA